MGSADTKFGYKVLKVQPNSPAEGAGLEPYIDVVVGINGATIAESEMPLQEILRRNTNCLVTLTVWNVLRQEMRDVKVRLRNDWGGEGVLGAKMGFEEIDEAGMKTYHVTEVAVGSPAALAGLIPLEDYILTAAEHVIGDSDELAILATYSPELKLAVYNKVKKNVREVILKPNASWGGSGALGCQIAEGLLHNIN